MSSFNVDKVKLVMPPVAIPNSFGNRYRQQDLLSLSRRSCSEDIFSLIFSCKLLSYKSGPDYGSFLDIYSSCSHDLALPILGSFGPWNAVPDVHLSHVVQFLLATLLGLSHVKCFTGRAIEYHAVAAIGHAPFVVQTFFPLPISFFLAHVLKLSLVKGLHGFWTEPVAGPVSPPVDPFTFNRISYLLSASPFL